MNSNHLSMTIAAPFALFVASCSSSPRGGASTGGQGGSTSTDTCGNVPNVNACGGDVAGTWSVTSSFLAVSGERNIEGISLGCVTASVTGSVQVSGSWIASADGTYTDQT